MQNALDLSAQDTVQRNHKCCPWSLAPIQYLEEFSNFYEIVGVYAMTGLVFNQMMLGLVSWFVFKWVYFKVFGIYAQDLKEQ